MPEITPDLRFTVKLTTEEFRLIAASLAKSDDPHAVALGAILVTNDRAFLQIPNLPGLENWATDL